MALSDVLRTTLRVARILDSLGVDYFVGGSLASSLHGIPRATQDVYLVAATTQNEVDGFVEALGSDSYLDEEMIREAIRRGASFNIIELETMFKVDVFVAQNDGVSQTEMMRRQAIQPGEDPGETLMVASPEDIILQKLAWYQLGDEASERQWLDALGVLKVQGSRLDKSYLQKTADLMGVAGLLRRALIEMKR
ncbi:MAG: hypothetical protein IH855_10205 [Bacteroidetes bacterium]|nr:hypothetical protein [Bacteroidota bacterium]